MPQGVVRTQERLSAAPVAFRTSDASGSECLRTAAWSSAGDLQREHVSSDRQRAVSCAGSWAGSDSTVRGGALLRRKPESYGRSVPDREAPQVTVDAPTGTVPADVLEHSADGFRGSGWRLCLGLAVVLVAAVVMQRGQPAPLPERGLSLLQTGGGTSLELGYGGRLDVQLPLFVSNDGDPVVVGTLALERSAFFHPATDIVLATGGRLPVTLRRVLDCRTRIGLPGDAVLRMTLRRDGQLESRRLALPEQVVAELRRDLEELCGDVPLSQAVVLEGDLERVRSDAVERQVLADDISGVGVRLLSVEPASGLRVTASGLPAGP